MTLWFGASAVAPELTDAWNPTGAEAAWLPNAIRIGFVVVALLSAALALSDAVPPGTSSQFPRSSVRSRASTRRE